MREDLEKFNWEQDLEDLKADIDKLSGDIAHLMRTFTVGQIEDKIAKHPFSSLLWAFGGGMACCAALQLFCCCKKKQ